MLKRRIKNNNTTLNKKMPAIATSGIRGPIPVMILHPLLQVSRPVSEGSAPFWRKRRSRSSTGTRRKYPSG